MARGGRKEGAMDRGEGSGSGKAGPRPGSTNAKKSATHGDAPAGGSKEDIKELGERIGKLEDALAEVARPYAELVGYLEKFQELSKGYFKLMGLYQRHGKISPEMVIPGLKDPISKELVTLLMEKGAMNISEATDALRDTRGHSSRRIVRERLQKMEEEGIVVATSRGKHRKYAISEEVTNKWLEMLGMVKRTDSQ